jgi:hypothetical protein
MRLDVSFDTISLWTTPLHNARAGQWNFVAVSWNGGKTRFDMKAWAGTPGGRCAEVDAIGSGYSEGAGANHGEYSDATTLEIGNRSSDYARQLNRDIAYVAAFRGPLPTGRVIEICRDGPLSVYPRPLWCVVGDRDLVSDRVGVLDQGAKLRSGRPPFQIWAAPRVMIPAALGGAQVISIGQVVETDSAQALTWRKVKVLGQVSETDAAQAVTRVKRKALGQATETDVAQAVTRFAAGQLGQVVESDAAQAVTSAKRKALGQTVETDAAQAVTARKTRAVGQVAETDAAQAVTRRKARAVGQVAETDLAQPVGVSGSKVIAVGQVAETDLAQAVSWAPKKRAVAQTAETDLAQTVTARRTRGVAQATETDAARPILKVAGGAIGLALEIDIGRPITPAPHRLIGAVFETDLALEVAVTSGQFLDEPFFSHTLAAESRRIGHPDPSADSRRIGHTDMSFRRPF